MDRDKMLDKYRRTYAKTAAPAAEFGWEIGHELNDQTDFIRLEIILTRGGETIKIWWEEGRLLEAPVYSFGGVETKLRNHSAVLQQLAKIPNVNRSARRAQRQSGTVQAIEIIKALPWDPDELEDRDLKRLCYGKTLVWLNSLTGLPEQDRIWYGRWEGQRFIDDLKSGPNWNASNYKIKYSSTGRRIIMFVGVSGYRAVGVDALLQVL